MKFIILLFVMLNILNAEPREALLIGNYNYKKIPTLNNPINNLKELKATLENIGFNVKILTNLDSVNLEESIDLFAKRLAKNRDTIGFFYYTGHGCQVEHNGYLLPIDINSANKLKVKHHALKINEMIERLKEANNKVNMFFLDACRDVPTGTRGSSKGLGRITNTPKGTLVVYATEEGQTANDNSDFIKSIIDSIKEPKQTIRNLPYSISDIFLKKNTNQIPIFSAVGVPNIILNNHDKNEKIYINNNHNMSNIVVIDGLMYQNQPFIKKYTWKKAKKYCQNLTLGGYSGWRLPTKEELKKISTNEAINFLYIKKYFIKNMIPENDTFWSSYSSFLGDDKVVWCFAYDLNRGYFMDPTDKFNVLCVKKK